MMSIPDSIREQLQREKHHYECMIIDAQRRIREIDEFLNQDKTTINWAEKAEKAIRLSLQPLTTTEILEEIFSCNAEELTFPERRRHYIQQLSLSLNRLCSKGVLFSQTIKGIKGNFYFLSEWKDDQGNLRNDYRIYISHKAQKAKSNMGTRCDYTISDHIEIIKGQLSHPLS